MSGYGLLAMHSFIGHPSEMLSITEYFEKHGFTISNILHPGHGTKPEDFMSVKWTDLTANACLKLEELILKCEDGVFVCGQSMGGSLSLYLAQHYPEIKGIFTFAAPVSPFRMIYRFIMRLIIFDFWIKDPPIDICDQEAKKNIRGYNRFYSSSAKQLRNLLDHVKKHLAAVTQPIIIFHGKQDSIVKPSEAKKIFDKVSSEDKKIHYLPNSAHLLTMDFDKEFVQKTCLEFVERITGRKFSEV